MWDLWAMRPYSRYGRPEYPVHPFLQVAFEVVSWQKHGSQMNTYGFQDTDGLHKTYYHNDN
jgi:hypothetical protein